MQHWTGHQLQHFYSLDLFAGFVSFPFSFSVWNLSKSLVSRWKFWRKSARCGLCAEMPESLDCCSKTMMTLCLTWSLNRLALTRQYRDSQYVVLYIVPHCTRSVPLTWQRVTLIKRWTGVTHTSFWLPNFLQLSLKSNQHGSAFRGRACWGFVTGLSGGSTQQPWESVAIF